jgi:hypothetical protein
MSSHSGLLCLFSVPPDVSEVYEMKMQIYPRTATPLIQMRMYSIRPFKRCSMPYDVLLEI